MGLERVFLDMVDEYNRPYVCEECGGIMVFKGVGEYECELCGKIAYDDYGIVRNYIEHNKKCTAYEIEQRTGVSQKNIRRMLKEGRLEIAVDSNTFLHCERCGMAIRSGSFCAHCEAEVHRQAEEEQRRARQQNSKVSGFADSKKMEDGSKRFTRR